MKFHSTFFVAISVFLLCPAIFAAEPSWPVFHGPKGNNISPETGLLKSWPEGGPKLLWKAEGIGNTEYPGYSGVTIADGRLFTTGNVKEGDDEKKANSTVFALDAATGKPISPARRRTSAFVRSPKGKRRRPSFKRLIP